MRVKPLIEPIISLCLLVCYIYRGIPKPFVNIFISWYRNLSCQVRWINDISYSLPILSSLPQGSLLSLKFYNIVMDVVLLALQDSGTGCYINNCFASGFAYADNFIIYISTWFTKITKCMF